MDVNTGSTETVFDMALFDLHKYMGDGLECETDTDTAIAFSTHLHSSGFLQVGGSANIASMMGTTDRILFELGISGDFRS